MMGVPQAVQNLKLCWAFRGYQQRVTDCITPTTEREFYLKDDEQTNTVVITLASGDGKVCKVIYYAGKNAIDEHYNFFAAKILRSTLANAGCELLPLKKYNGEKLDGAILIQSTEKNSALGEGGYRLRITRGAATITGVRPGGAELGVLALWEKLGIRYYVPCEATLLTKERNASPCDETRVPGIPLRQWAPDRHGWGERLGYQEVTREIANYRYFGGDPVHSLPAFLSENEFRKTHPEYFALQSDGKRGCSQPGHLCLTNPEVISIVAGRILEVVARQPESNTSIFSGATAAISIANVMPVKKSDTRNSI